MCQRGSNKKRQPIRWSFHLIRLAILKTDYVRTEWVSEFGEYPDMFEAVFRKCETAITFQTFDAHRNEYPADLDEFDAYLITGSKSSVYDEEPWIEELMGFVRELHRLKKKLIGICFGHQLVAETLGGKVGKSSKGWGVGVHTHAFSEIPQWHDGQSHQFNILVSHKDQVIRNADGAKVLAGSEFCENAVCQLDNHILTFQGHPEFVVDYSRKIIGLRKEMIGHEVAQAGLASLSIAPDSEIITRWIINFINEKTCNSVGR